MLIPVVLAGGTGSRLWPVSRELRPKQFQRLLGDDSLFQQTLLRARKVADAAPIILGNAEHRFVAAEQCRQIGVGWQQIVLEPAVRSTAPAIALAALLARRDQGLEAKLLVLPSDHLIEGDAAFADAVAQAVQAADQGQLVTFGIEPDRAETGYGYIKAEGSGASAARKVEAFVEKPDAETAARYLAEGCYFWNSGMFLFGAERYLSALKAHAPAVLAAAQQSIESGSDDLDFFRPGDAFLESPNISIDYAVMEHSDAVSVVPSTFSWSDVGSWDSVRTALPQDEAGNALHGDVVAIDTQDSLIRSEYRLIATLGIRNTIVVETADAVLVADERYVQDVKRIVSELSSLARTEHHSHRKVFRPWGAYESLEHGPRFQVKRITVNPDQAISLQKHHNRSEHWVVVRGTAEVTRGEEKLLVTENESVYIPLGTVHRLANPGKTPLELIEVQVGSYLGEDDIVRLEDVYGRA